MPGADGPDGGQGFPGRRGTRGTIRTIDGSTLTVATDQQGATDVTVATSTDTKVTETVTGTLSDVKVGDTVTVQGTTSGDTVAATDGDRPRHPGARPAEARAGAAKPHRGRPSERGDDPEQGQGGQGGNGRQGGPGTIGQVTAVSGSTLTVTTLQGSTVTVTTTADTQVMVTRDIGLSDLAVGDTVTVTGPLDGSTVAATAIRKGELGGFGGPGGAPPTGAPGAGDGTASGNN